MRPQPVIEVDAEFSPPPRERRRLYDAAARDQERLEQEWHFVGLAEAARRTGLEPLQLEQRLARDADRHRWWVRAGVGERPRPGADAEGWRVTYPHSGDQSASGTARVQGCITTCRAARCLVARSCWCRRGPRQVAFARLTTTLR